jgi:hypothetical protein
MKWFKNPLSIVALLLLGIMFWTLRQEREERQRAIGKVTQAWVGCQPAVYLATSKEPVDAVPLLRYRDNENGRVCVFLRDGRYGLLWWSAIKESDGKSHLEWQFQEWGKYKW